MKKIILASVAFAAFAFPALAFDGNSGIVGGISGTGIAGGSSASSKNGGAASATNSTVVSTSGETVVGHGVISQTSTTLGASTSNAATTGGKGNKASAGGSFVGGTVQFGVSAPSHSHH